MSDTSKEALGSVAHIDEAARKAEFDAFFKTLPEATQILRDTVPEDSETWRRAQTIGNEAPELAPYHNEPGQFKSAGVGKNGFLRLKMRRNPDGQTIMVDMERRTPFIILKSLCWDEAMPDMRCLYIITTGGGILQGDRYAIDFLIEEGAEAHISTQSANKIQAMDANYAVQTQTIKVEDNAYFEYMPDLTIPCVHSRYLTDTRIEMGENATMLYGEILVPGRIHHKPEEYFGFDVFSSCVTGYDKQGNETFCEKFILEPGRGTIQQLGVMNGFDVFANVIVLTPKHFADEIFAQMGVDYDIKKQLASGLSLLPNDAGLVFKVLGKEVKPVRERIHEFWKVVRKVVKGTELPDPFLWRPY